MNRMKFMLFTHDQKAVALDLSCLGSRSRYSPLCFLVFDKTSSVIRSISSMSPTCIKSVVPVAAAAGVTASAGGGGGGGKEEGREVEGGTTIAVEVEVSDIAAAAAAICC